MINLSKRAFATRVEHRDSLGRRSRRTLVIASLGCVPHRNDAVPRPARAGGSGLPSTLKGGLVQYMHFGQLAADLAKIAAIVMLGALIIALEGSEPKDRPTIIRALAELFRRSKPPRS
jgi:hypothetical protein